MRVHTSPYPPIEIPELSITELVLRHADERATEPALIDGLSGRTIDYASFARSIRELAGALVQRGFGAGKVLAIMAPNDPGYAVTFHAAAWAGGTVTTINPTYTASEVHHQLEDSGAEWLITSDAVADVARQAAANSAVREVALFGELSGEPLAERVAVEPDDVVALPYSSGTTGLSKGVMLTHRNLVANVLQTLVALPMQPGEAVVAFLPFFHIYGMQVLMNAALASGATLVTLPRFDLERFLTLLSEHRATRAFAVPPVVLALAKHPIVDRFDLSALKQIFSGAAPLGIELAETCGERLDCEVAQGYGLTESSPVSHATAVGNFKPGTVGTLVPSTECRIVDPESGEDLDLDAPGELWIRGPQVMTGYHGNPEATAATLDADGWLHTGDIGQVDADGHFTIVDRLKELIKVKGFQVPPAELEALLVSHPKIADAAVIGVPDDEAGERPKAFVVRREGQALDEDEVLAFVAERVARYKHLHAVAFVDAIPKSASGKIMRRLLPQ